MNPTLAAVVDGMGLCPACRPAVVRAIEAGTEALEAGYGGQVFAAAGIRPRIDVGATR